MKTDVDTCLKDIADWYIGHKRDIKLPELEPILAKHCGSNAEVRKFIGFMETEPGRLRFKTLLRERKGEQPSYLVGKEPWQMTRAEYVDSVWKGRLFIHPKTGYRFKPLRQEDYLIYVHEALPEESRAFKERPKQHRLFVTQALSEGKPVPSSVLADYPDLAKAIPKAEAVPRVREAIRQAVEEHPYRLEHGFDGRTTGFTGFWITKQGKIYQHSRLNDIPLVERQGLTNVHSHSPSGWQARLQEGKLDAFDPFSSGDIENLQWGVRKGVSDTSVVIMADGRMELLHIPDNAKASFIALSKREIRKVLDIPYEQRKAIIGVPDHEIYRNALRQFAEQHGLVYQTELSWKQAALPKAEAVTY